MIRPSLRHLPILLATLMALPLFARTWYVDNSRSEGDGSAAAPFPSLAEAERSSGAGDVLVVFGGTGPYSGGIALQDGQTLRGQSGHRRAPVILAGDSHAISIAGSAHVEGLSIEGGGAGAAVRIEGGKGEVTLAAVSIDRTGGPAVVMRNHEGNVTFARGCTIKVTAGTMDAISLRDSRSMVTFAEPLRIATTGARAVVAEKMTRLVMAPGSVLESADAAVVELRDVELDAVIDALSVSSPAGSLERGVILERTTGRLAVNGGSIRGASLRGIDLRGASNITLRNLTLTGNAARNAVAAAECAADLLVNDIARCSAAVSLQDVQNLTVEDLRIDGSGQLGISGVGVRNATFLRVAVGGAGDELGEHALVFRNVTGDVVFRGCTVTRPASRGLYVVNDAGASTIEVEDCRFAESVQPHGQQGILVAAEGEAVMALRVRKNTFAGLYAAGIQVSASGTSSLDFTATGNTFARTGGAVNLVADKAATAKFDIADNRVSGSSTNAINVALSANAARATMSGTIARNEIGRDPVACPQCSGISVRSGGAGTLAANIHGNDVSHSSGPAIWSQAQGRSRLDVAITANRLTDPDATGISAIRVQAGAVPADSAVVCARIGGGGALANKAGDGWDARGAIQLVNRTASSLRLSGLEGSDDDAVAAWIGRQNAGASARIVRASSPRADAIVAGAECGVPDVR